METVNDSYWKVNGFLLSEKIVWLFIKKMLYYY
jgi:hypothetical protein